MGEDQLEDNTESKFDHPLVQVGIFGCLTILGIYMYFTGSFKPDSEWMELLLYFGYFVFFPIMFVISVMSYIRGWSDETSDSVIIKVFGWLLGGPIIFIILACAIFFVGNYLVSIPSWATIIIILLLMLVFKKS